MTSMHAALRPLVVALMAVLLSCAAEPDCSADAGVVDAGDACEDDDEARLSDDAFEPGHVIGHVEDVIR